MSLAAYHSIDLAQKSAAQGGLSLPDLEAILSDMRTAPAWRARADLECDYYDSNQHTPDEIERADRLGLPIITVNLIFATLNLIIGMEAKTRTDWKVEPDGPTVTEDFTDALTVKLVEAERVTMADRACAAAYASQMKAGLGWVHVGRNLDPFMYKHKVEDVDRREIWWDMRGRKDDTTDWRWLVRRKWHDADYLKACFPRVISGMNVHEIIDAVTSHTAPWDHAAFMQAIPLLQDGMIERDWNGGWGYDEWRDSERKRALLYEVWYRVWQRGYVMELPDGRVVEYDERNPLHMAAAATGVALPVEALYSKVRMSWWLGPVRLYDMASPFSHPYFPYVPFFAYREDKTRVPYGQIRVMVSMQDEINARRAKMLWQLSSNRVTARESAFKDHEQARAEINRPDAYLQIPKNPDTDKRTLEDLVKIEEHTALNSQQFDVYKDSCQQLNSVAGVYGPMLGDADAGAEAGVAIDMLIQQGSTTLAGPNDNFRFGRKLVGEQLLANLVVDMAKSKRPIPVQLPKDHPNKPGQVITLNQPGKTAEDLPIMSNDVTRLKTRVTLADVPSSAGYQQQQFQLVSEVLKGLPPELQPIIIDMWVQMSNVPNKSEMARRLRQATGQAGPPPNPDTMAPDQLAIAEQEQVQAAQQAQTAQQMQQLQNMGAMADIADKAASAKLKEAQVVATLVKTGDIEGSLIDVVKHPEMQGMVRVNVKPPPPPVIAGPGGKPGGKPGDSKGGQRRASQERAAGNERDSAVIHQR